MKPFIIFGKGDFADIVEYIIVEEMHEKVFGYTVNERYLDQKEWKGKPVVPYEEIEEYYAPGRYNCVIAYEGKDLYRTREALMDGLRNKGFSLGNVVSDSAILTNADIGSGNIIMQGVLLAPYAKVGNGNVFWGSSQVQHHNKVGNYNCFAPGVVTCGYAEIPDHCFFGANATVKSGIHISDRTFVGANVYIDRDTETDSVWLPPRAYSRAELVRNR